MVVLSMLFPELYTEDTMGIYENGQDIGPVYILQRYKTYNPNGTLL